MEKTPQQAEKEKLQKEWEDTVKETLDLIVAEIPKLAPGAIDARATIYRELLAIKDTVAQCPPAVRKSYNKALDTLYGEMDAIPNSMYLSDSDPKP